MTKINIQRSSSEENDKVKNVNIHITTDIHKGYYLLLHIKIYDIIFRKISFVKAGLAKFNGIYLDACYYLVNFSM